MSGQAATVSARLPLLSVKETGCVGLGIFTETPIACGTVALVVEGPERVWRSGDPKDADAFPNWIGVGPDRWIDPEGKGEFLNHSCEPNLGFHSERELVALRDIGAGEQLTIDYATTEDEVHWRMSCACGAESCRGTIRSVQFLPAEVYERLWQYMLSHFRQVYERAVRRRRSPPD